MPYQFSEKPLVSDNQSSEIWVSTKSLIISTNEITKVKFDSTKKTCKRICQLYKASGMQHNVRYKAGQKRCTHCQVYMITDMVKCPCCKTTLRTKPRSKRIWNQLEEIPAL